MSTVGDEVCEEAHCQAEDADIPGVSGGHHEETDNGTCDGECAKVGGFGDVEHHNDTVADHSDQGADNDHEGRDNSQHPTAEGDDKVQSGENARVYKVPRISDALS